MAQLNKLSKREWEVVKVLLQGKSNKIIASTLGISERTVEFHLKNIYTKYQVSSRIELILILGKTTGEFEFEKLRNSTVDNKREKAENRGRLDSRTGWAISFRDTISSAFRKFEMKNLLSSKHLFVGIVTAFVTGALWTFALSPRLSPDQIKTWAAPLIIIWAMIGLSVGLVGKRNGTTPIKVGFSTLLGTGLSPLTVIPLMFIFVLPIGKFAEQLGFINPSTMSSEVATTLTTMIMTAIWFVVAVTIGIVLLFVTIQKPEPPVVRSHISENGF